MAIERPTVSDYHLEDHRYIKHLTRNVKLLERISKFKDGTSGNIWEMTDEVLQDHLELLYTDSELYGRYPQNYLKHCC